MMFWRKRSRFARAKWAALAVLYAIPFSLSIARPLDPLPGEEVMIQESAPPPRSQTPATPSDASATWLAPSIGEQLNRDRNLLTVSKGAIFIPSFSESRREPEVGVYNSRGELIRTGLTGNRLLVDSGQYEVRVGSGAQGQQMRRTIHVEEGHTEVIQPTWGGLLVETLTSDGEYFEGQYEVIRIDRVALYGRGRGFGEERLQDIKVWLLPPGVYRLGKVGDPASSLRSYITVEVPAGELRTIELIFASKSSESDIVSGGFKALNARTAVGRNWTFGMRVGGNLSFVSAVDDFDSLRQSGLWSSDVRMRARYDKAAFFGISEFSMRDNLVKKKNTPISVDVDDAQARTTWVRRINAWFGPYVRAQVSTHFFSRYASADTVQIGRVLPDSSGAPRFDTLYSDTTRDFLYQPSFFPLKLSEGLGVNLDLLNFNFIELSTQVGLAAHQQISEGDYFPFTSTEFFRSESQSTVGVETLINGRVRLTNMLTLDLRTELFMPDAKPAQLQLTDFELDVRLSLSRFMELGYLFQVSETDKPVANRFPSSHNVSLRFSLNY